MKKWLKVLIAIVVTIILYVIFFNILISGATSENYYFLLETFFESIIFAIIALPVGILGSHLINKWIDNPEKRNIAMTGLAVMWGATSGWLSATGIIIGEFIMEKQDLKDQKKKTKKGWFYNEYNNLKFFDWIIAGVVGLILVAIPLLSNLIFSLDFQGNSTYVFGVLFGIGLLLTAAFMNEGKTKKEKKLTGLQKAILYIGIIYLLINGLGLVTTYFMVPLDEQERAVFDLEEEYYNAIAYYYDNTALLDNEFQAAIVAEDYDLAYAQVDEITTLRKAEADFVISSCKKVENSSMDLTQSPNLADLSKSCQWQQVIIDCVDEETEQNKQIIDLFQNMNERDYEACLDVFHPARSPGNCDFLAVQLGWQTPTAYDAEVLCREYFPNG